MVRLRGEELPGTVLSMHYGSDAWPLIRLDRLARWGMIAKDQLCNPEVVSLAQRDRDARMKHQKPAVRKERDTRRSFSPLTIERAQAACAVLEELFSALDCLRVAAEASGDSAVVGETRITKERIAESHSLVWLRELSGARPRKTKRKP